MFTNNGFAKFPRVYRTEKAPRIIAVGTSPVNLMLLPILTAFTLPIVQPVSQKSPAAPWVKEETPQFDEYTTSMYELVVVIL